VTSVGAAVGAWGGRTGGVASAGPGAAAILNAASRVGLEAAWRPPAPASPGAGEIPPAA
jgi:hypothetical protein